MSIAQLFGLSIVPVHWSASRFISPSTLLFLATSTPQDSSCLLENNIFGSAHASLLDGPVYLSVGYSCGSRRVGVIVVIVVVSPTLTRLIDSQAMRLRSFFIQLVFFSMFVKKIGDGQTDTDA